MAKYIDELTAVTSPVDTDLLIVETDPAGTPEEKGWTIANLKAFLGRNYLTNYVITPSVSSNNLTVALKTLAGVDPSASDPLKFRAGDTQYTVTSATSYTKNAGTNWHNSGSSELAAQNVEYFMYAIGETGASAGIKFGHSRISHAKTMGDFVNTTTSEKYIAGNWTNFNSTDKVEVIGRFRAQLSAGAGYTWSIPSVYVVNRPIYETEWLAWTPTFAGNASMTYTTVTATHARYKVAEKKVLAELNMSGTTGGTASNILKASPPFSFSLGTTPFFGGALVAAVFGGVRCNSGNLEFLKYDLSNYALGTIAGSTTGFYEI